MTATDQPLIKRTTGISGLDAVTHGGLPAGGATLVLGAPGSGKTVLGLQMLARAIERGEGGLMVSFEESSDQIARDAASFNWRSGLLGSDRLHTIDARPPSGADAAGAFNLGALLSGIGATIDRLGAACVVADGIDRLLRLQPDRETAVDEVARLNEWCASRGVTLLLTGKHTDRDGTQPAYLEGVEYMLDTVIVLSTELVGRRLSRRFRIAKYRGTAHATDELAMVIDDDGVQLPYEAPDPGATAAPTQRVGTGVPRLDKVLGGGLHRGSTLLMSGAPGTAKTTLAASFALGAAQRGERALYLSFDELADRIVRNLASIGMDLQPHVDTGALVFDCREAWRALVEEHYIGIQRRLDGVEPHCLVIDPVSALLKAGGSENAFVTMERLLDSARRRGITTVLTSLTEGEDPDTEGTLSHVSTLADTWITLGYHVRGGERNRTLSVVKSRGSAHSNQVRELLLSADGIDLADVYEYGTEVLLGTARLQKESEQAATRRRRVRERGQRQRELERRVEQARARMEEASSEAERLQGELERERGGDADADRETREHDEAVHRRRDPERSPDDDGAEAGAEGENR